MRKFTELTEEQKQDLSIFALSAIAFPVCTAAGVILPKINSGDWTASLFICFPLAAFFAFAFFAYSVYFFHEIKRVKKNRKPQKSNKKVA